MILPALMIALLLSGCGSEEQWEKKVLEHRSVLNEAQSISFTAELRADCGDSEFLCKLNCAAENGKVSVELTEPTEIAGIKAVFDGESTDVEYSGASLSLGQLPADGASPITAAPVILEALKNGYITQLWTESGDGRELVVLKVFVSDGLHARIWLEAGGLTPVHAELLTKDKVVISCDIDGFTAE